MQLIAFSSSTPSIQFWKGIYLQIAEVLQLVALTYAIIIALKIIYVQKVSQTLIRVAFIIIIIIIIIHYLPISVI